MSNLISTRPTATQNLHIAIVELDGRKIITIVKLGERHEEQRTPKKG